MKKKLIFVASILSVAFIFRAEASAQWVQTSGPTGNGTFVECFAVNGTNLFAGTQDGGVFLSTNNGTSWTWVGVLNGATALTISGTNIFAGTYGIAGLSGDGVFLSTDTGKSWTAVNNGLTESDVTAFATIGTNIFLGSKEGVFLSTNSGSNWTAVSNGLPSNYYVLSIAASGSNLFVADGGGVFLSTNNGTSWTDVSNGIPANTIINSFAVSGTNLFAGGNGIFLSTNNGTSWTVPSTSLTGKNVNTLTVSGGNLFAGTQFGVFLSTDNGTNWKAANIGLMDSQVLSLAVGGTNLYAGTNSSGVWRRPLSEMINTSAVATPAPIQTSISTYPNPLSQSTTIRFTSAESGVARVTVVNLLGEEVARVFEGALTSGEHSWVWSKLTGLPTGMYECVVEMNGSVQQVPVVVTR